jgi:hypothetical protein
VARQVKLCRVTACVQPRAFSPRCPVRSASGLRDRALLGVLAYSFARIGAVVNLKVEDYSESLKGKTIAIIRATVVRLVRWRVTLPEAVNKLGLCCRISWRRNKFIGGHGNSGKCC